MYLCMYNTYFFICMYIDMPYVNMTINFTLTYLHFMYVNYVSIYFLLY